MTCWWYNAGRIHPHMHQSNFFHPGDAYMDHVATSQLRYLINSEERLRGK